MTGEGKNMLSELGLKQTNSHIAYCNLLTTLCCLPNEFRCGLYFELLLFPLNLQVFVVDLFAALAAAISGMTNMHYQANLTQSVLQAFKRKVSMYGLASMFY